MQTTVADNCGPESSVAFWINRASRLIVRRTDAGLRPLGLALSHLPVLRALADGASLSQTELARSAGVEQPSMAETVARMERDGVLQRGPHPNDRRATLMSLTRRAHTRMPKALAVLREGERAAMTGLSDEEQALLRGLLRRVVGNLEAQLPAAASTGALRPRPARARARRQGHGRPDAPARRPDRG
jgi:DNA-binding MarR family transcriptional regulator